MNIPKLKPRPISRCDLIIPPKIEHDLEEVARYKIAAENAARNAAARVVEFVEWRGKKVELNEFLRRAENAEGDERRALFDALSRFNPLKTTKPAPCPKCGPLNDVLFANDEWHGIYCYCPHCGRRGPDGNKSVNEAVAAWNRRAWEETK